MEIAANEGLGSCIYTNEGQQGLQVRNLKVRSFGEQPRGAPVPAHPDRRAAEPPHGRDLRHALGDGRDRSRLRPEAPEGLLEDGPVRLVAPGLLGGDNRIERGFELPGRGGEQVVVDV